MKSSFHEEKDVHKSHFVNLENIPLNHIKSMAIEFQQIMEGAN
jgi:hypothetical protein